MKAKDFLKQYEYAQQRADMCREEYEVEMLKIDAIGSTLAGDGQPHGSGISRKTEDKALRLAEKAKRWKSVEREALKERQEVFEVVSMVNGIEGKILYQRYVDLNKWEQICVNIPMSWTGVHKAHKRALAIVQGILDNRV